MTEVTRLVEAVDAGDTQAAHALLPKVYAELRSLAIARLSKERPGQTLQATALVHEAWLRLVSSERQKWRGQAHFFSAAAEAMRRILVDQARRKAAVKRGERVEVEALNESVIAVNTPDDELLAVNDAVDRLGEEDRLCAEIVKLRYFVGLSRRETAEALEISQRALDRNWAYARAWLRDALSSDELSADRP